MIPLGQKNFDNLSEIRKKVVLTSIMIPVMVVVATIVFFIVFLLMNLSQSYKNSHTQQSFSEINIVGQDRFK